MIENKQIEKLAEEKYPSTIDVDGLYFDDKNYEIKRNAFIAGYTAANKGVGMKWCKCSKETNPTKQGWYLLQAPESSPTQVGRSWFDGKEWKWDDTAKAYLSHNWAMEWLDESQSEPNKDDFASTLAYSIAHSKWEKSHQPLPDATKEIDLDDVEKFYEQTLLSFDAQKGNFSLREVAVKAIKEYAEIRSRPEFQLRQGDGIAEWISVKDKLPEQGQKVIVIQNPETTATKEPLFAIYNSGRFDDPQGTIDGIHFAVCHWVDIIYWMPLPEYKSRPELKGAK